jgi:serine/threonine-protein kinase
MLKGILGKGGTSRVFAAYDTDLERELAIKVVPRSESGLSDQLAREARITAKLSHPNVPPIFDVGHVGEDYFLALPLVRGKSLRFLIRRAIKEGETTALPAQDLVQVLLKVCDALSYSHARGIIHKDVKPENIMVGQYGEVMVVDWGAAVIVGEPTEPDVVVGTPAYMAPEQALGRPIDLRADVYALGATLFHSLMLRKPLKRSGVHETLEAKLAGETDPPTPEELACYPRALIAIAQRAMSFNRNERYETVAAFADALRAYLAGGDNWSEPILDETFQESEWTRKWATLDPEGFARRPLKEQDWTRRSSPPSQRAAFVGAAGGASQSSAQLRSDYIEWCLETAKPGVNAAFFPEVFEARVSIDFEGTLLRGYPDGELAVVWTEDEVVDSDGRAALPQPGTRTFTFRVGALSNRVAGIFMGLHEPLATLAHRQERGRPSRIKIEVDDRLLRLTVDGEPLAEHKLRQPLGSGRFGLLGTNASRAFA